jgi:hypothetical protein
MRNLIAILEACVMTVALYAQTSQRFPAPLGIDRVLTGIVSECVASTPSKAAPKAKRRRDPRCGGGADYLLIVGDTVYTLHGHVTELAQRVGKSTVITGNVVGNDVAVHSVNAAER